VGQPAGRFEEVAVDVDHAHRAPRASY
jgi:hypothetical protein